MPFGNSKILCVIVDITIKGAVHVAVTISIHNHLQISIGQYSMVVLTLTTSYHRLVATIGLNVVGYIHLSIIIS